MNHFLLMLIIPFLTIMIEGPELCFDNSGEMHLSCCCSKEVSIKGQCCSSGCSKVEITVSSMLTRVVQLETDDISENSDNSFEKFITGSFSTSRFEKPVKPVLQRLSIKEPDIPQKLSKIILRC